MSRIISKKRVLLTAAIASLALVAVAIAYWTTNGTGSGSGSTSAQADGAITLVGVIDDATLAPGKTSPITITATNTDTKTDLRVQSTTLTDVNVVDDGTAHDGCLESWFTSSGSPVAQNQTIEADSNPVEDLNAKHSISFANDAANQDECKGATIEFTLSSN
jgi:hypothetical protein